MAASVPYRIFPGIQPYQRTILELKCPTKIYGGLKTEEREDRGVMKVSEKESP